MTKAELITMLSARYAEKSELNATQFFAAVQDAAPNVKTQLLVSVNKKDMKSTAEILIQIANEKRLSIANAAVTAAFTDDTVTTNDLLTFL